MHRLQPQPGAQRDRTQPNLSQQRWASYLNSDIVVEPMALKPGAMGAPAVLRTPAPSIPDYLRDTYTWAYLNPRNVKLLDRLSVVQTILWGNYGRLKQVAVDEMEPGQSILQSASVYGDLSAVLAKHLGPQGKLEVNDVAPVQVASCKRKLRDFPNATVRLADAANPARALYDVVCCFFLLHEVPEDYKRRVVNAQLGCVAPGGKAVFVDYHRPHWAHPLKPLMSLVFDTLEPFAKGLWDHAISDYASDKGAFVWSKQTYFGGLYQKTVARRRDNSDR